MPILYRRALCIGLFVVAAGGPSVVFGQAQETPAKETTAKEKPAKEKPVLEKQEPSAEHLNAYCAWRGAKADAEKSLLWAPDVVAWSWGDGLYDSSVLMDNSALRGRVLAGLRYDFSDLYRGFLRGDEAETACERYQAKSRFEAALNGGAEIGQREALEAQQKVLADAIPQAKEVIEGLKRAVDGKRASDRELRALQIRLDALEGMAQDTRDELVQLGDSSENAPQLYELLDAFVKADTKYQRAQAKTKRSHAWELSVAAGYSHRFGEGESAPLFAGGSFSFNIGQLWEASASERAIEAHERWQETRLDGPGGRLRELVRAHQFSARADREKLQANAMLLADLEARLERLAPLKGQEAVSYRNLVWFDYAQLLAESATVAERLKHTKTFLSNMEAQEAKRDEDGPAEDMPTYVTRTFALAYQPTPMSEVKEPATPQEVLKKLKQYDPRTFDMVIGEVEPKGEKSLDFGIQVPKSRGYLPGSDGRLASVRFKYDGPSEETADFASGRSRAQLGLKLRAQDSCNTLYVMWRIDPDQRIMVSSKSNPGEHLNRQCGNAGYSNLRATSVTHPPLVKPGETHTLGAYLKDEVLQVFVDDKLVWKGDVGTLSYEGSTGFRTDNGLFSDVAIFSKARE